MPASGKWEPVSRRLDDLRPGFRGLVFEFLARLTEAGIPVMIVDTLRTREEQDACIDRGVSWTFHSRHLDGLAIDVCPFAIFALHGANKLQWDTKDPVWQKIISIGEACGLHSGKNFPKPDLGHFELLVSQGLTYEQEATLEH